MKEPFVLGRAKSVITPPLGTPLYGYPRYEQRKATAVLDDLHANAAVFGYGKPSALLLSLEICAVRAELVGRIFENIAREVPIPKENMIVCEIHTHSGPCCTFTPGWGVSNDSYIEEILIPQCVCAAKAAYENAEEALLGIGTTESHVGINRRQLIEDGRAGLGQNPYGCFDPEMTVLSFVSKGEKKPLLNIVHYGAHATASGANPEITRDWPGYMIDRMEAQTGAMTFFVNGAEGDVGPRLTNGRTTGNVQLAAELGGVAAMDAMRAYRSVREYREVDFAVLHGEIRVPYKPFPSKEEIEKELCELEKGEIVGTAIIQQNTLKQRLAVHENGEEIPECWKFSQVILRLNSALIVPFPFEVFSEITVRLRQYSPFGHTLSLCNANGALAYLPSKEQIARGGYEVDQFTRRHVFTMVDDTDTRIVAENMRIIRAYAEKEE